MNDEMQASAQDALENRSRELFQDSVGNVDMRVRSRLTQARHAAIDAAADAAAHRRWVPHMPFWTPAAGVAAAALLGVALWFGGPGGHAGGEPQGANLEDLDIVTASDGAAAPPMEMLQDDIDFYDFADTAANAGPAA